METGRRHPETRSLFVFLLNMGFMYPLRCPLFPLLVFGYPYSERLRWLDSDSFKKPAWSSIALINASCSRASPRITVCSDKHHRKSWGDCSRFLSREKAQEEGRAWNRVYFRLRQRDVCPSPLLS